MDRTCIVVANAGRARFFIQHGPQGALQEAGDLVNPAARLRTADTETDRMGTLAAGKSSFNTGAALPNSGYEPPQTPEEHATEQFARELARHLQERQQAGQFEQLALVAAPEFLGLLRRLLDKPLAALLRWDLNKDYTQLAPAQLAEQLAARAPRQQD